MIERGEAQEVMLRAAIAGKSFEDAGVPDTPDNRRDYADIAREIAQAPPGTIIEIPFDWASGEPW